MAVQFSGSRNDIRQVALVLAGILAGTQADVAGIGRGFALALGFGALSDIKDAYVTKSRGGTDEMGISWPPLSNRYLAYGRRFGPGEQASLKRGAGLGKGNRLAPGGNKGLLNAAQLRQWRSIYGSRLARFMLSMPEGAAKARAAAIAWAELKRAGAKTKLEVYGNRKVEILRDTGVLLNSLSPGIMSGVGPYATYSKPPGGQDQVFEAAAGRVAVGTNVAYANAHQTGKGVPRRQFLPDSAEQIPDVWWDRWLAISVQAAEAGALLLFERAGQ